MKKVVPLLVALAVAWFYTNGPDGYVDSAPPATSSTTPVPVSLVSGSQVAGSGIVVRILSDDNDDQHYLSDIIQIVTYNHKLIICEYT